MRSAAHLTHLTPFMANLAHAICNTTQKSSVIGNGINLEEWQEARKLLSTDYMLAIGRIEQSKGFQILIAAFAHLFKEGRQTTLVIVGKGSYENDLQHFAQQLGLPVRINHSYSAPIPPAHVVFMPYISGVEKKELFGRSAFVLFAPQCEESFGIVQLEAMAAGKALLASNLAATRYLQCLGFQSTLVPANNIHAWAEQMRVLLDNPTSRIATAKINLKYLEQFSWRHIAEQYKQVYDKIYFKEI